jgi:hypothetical protein
MKLFTSACGSNSRRERKCRRVGESRTLGFWRVVLRRLPALLSSTLEFLTSKARPIYYSGWTRLTLMYTHPPSSFLPSVFLFSSLPLSLGGIRHVIAPEKVKTTGTHHLLIMRVHHFPHPQPPVYSKSFRKYFRKILVRLSPWKM